jgi:hypothetical protein
MSLQLYLMAVTLSKWIPGAISWFSYLPSQKSGWRRRKTSTAAPWRSPRSSGSVFRVPPLWSIDRRAPPLKIFKAQSTPPAPGPRRSLQVFTTEIAECGRARCWSISAQTSFGRRHRMIAHKPSHSQATRNPAKYHKYCTNIAGGLTAITIDLPQSAP